MCEHREALQKARYELELMIGNQRLDYGKLRHLLNQGCQEAHNE